MPEDVALITGGSGRLGRATALAFARRGWTVVLVGRKRQALEAVAEQIRVAGGHAVVEPLDAADAVAVASMSGRVRVAHGAPDVIVHAAGTGQWRWPEDTPPDAMERALDAPFRADYNVTHAFLADLLNRGSGVIVHVGSPVSFAPWPAATAYAVAHAAVRGFHEALRQDLAGTGVHSCHVVFGPVVDDPDDDGRPRRPRLGRLVRSTSAQRCAEVILDVADGPTARRVHPPSLRRLLRLNRLAPRLGAWLLRATGERRKPADTGPRRRLARHRERP